MDRILQSYVDNFKESMGISETDISKIFEHFVNYSVTFNSIFDKFNYEDIDVDKNEGTQSIDGFGIILNGHLVTNTDEIDDIFLSKNQIDAKIIFIQSKRSTNLSTQEIGHFSYGIIDFLSETPKIKWSTTAKQRINLFNHLISKYPQLKEKPTCECYYVTTGNNNVDENIKSRIETTKSDISDLNLFSTISFTSLGTNDLQKKYRSATEKISFEFKFENKILLPDVEQVKQSYIGMLPAKIIINIISINGSELNNTLFYENIRDFQGHNKVNKGIQNTIESNNPEKFILLNNGITIVTEKIDTIRNDFTITNFQIVNGCQTCNILFEAREHVSDNLFVPVKLIECENTDIVNEIISATNSQTEVKDEDLLAFSDFQKKLEAFYKTFELKEKLYYERRSKQYHKDISIEKIRIVDKVAQIKTFASLFLDKPHLATRFYGTLINEFGDLLFQDSHEIIIYYTSSILMFHLESLIRRNAINRKYNKFRYFILMALKWEINGYSQLPQFNSKKINEYCNNLIKILENEDVFLVKINNILTKMEQYITNFDDLELTKSKRIAEELEKLYKQTLIN